MEFNLITNIDSCYIEIPNLLYYSHIPTAIISLLMSLLVFLKSKNLASKALLTISIVFSLWLVCNLFTWISVDSRIIIFAWSFMGALTSLVFILAFYFFYVYVKKSDLPFGIKIIFVFFVLPIILLAPTYLREFNIVDCEAVDDIRYVYYYNGINALILILLPLFTFFQCKKTTGDFKRQIIYLAIGTELFLLLFFVTGFLGSYLDSKGVPYAFEIDQYGLFGMTIFMGVLAYLIVKFKAFEIKLIGAQALMVSLVILVGSQFFFVKTTTNMVLTGITLVLSILFGFFLIKSVKSEIQRKEELQYMADKLAQSNDKLRQLDNAKTEFISIASHQLRTPLTAIKGFIALILEGSYGDINTGVNDALVKVQVSTERLINLVEDLLNVSRIESGRMEYKMVDQDITKLLMELDGSFAIVSKNKGLSFETKLPEEKLPNVSIDDAKMREVISNLIDNALKYTEKGGVTVRAEYGTASTFKSYGENEVNKQAQQYQGNARPSANGYVRVVVSDTGIGIPETELPYLFSKFSRGKDTTRLHVGGTGLGLYVGKNIVEAHGGKVWAESDGDGLGSRFIVELPVA